MPGDRVVGTGCAALDYIPSRYNVLLPSGSSHENALVGTQCVKVVSQSVSQFSRTADLPSRVEPSLMSWLFFFAPTANGGCWWSCRRRRERQARAEGNERLLEGFRTVPTTLVALASEPGGTLSQPSGQS